MRLGVDLDNTIVCYDQLFVRLARERGVIPPELPPTKRAVRDHLRRQGMEHLWTELQGIAYGSRMEEAIPFPGVLDFFGRATAAKVDWWIISHRSREPYRGPAVDLHAAARRWLAERGIVDPEGPLQKKLKLELTREAKLQQIIETGCEAFVDDLPELLGDPAFPPRVHKFLFDPDGQAEESAGFERIVSWESLADRLGLADRTAPRGSSHP